VKPLPGAPRGGSHGCPLHSFGTLLAPILRETKRGLIFVDDGRQPAQCRGTYCRRQQPELIWNANGEMAK
jgi:hypothetical protein